MTIFLGILLMLSQIAQIEMLEIFQFNKHSDLSNWYIVDDVVMGGRSKGKLQISREGHGLFSGDVSLENYGGFSSIRYRSDKQDISKYNVCKITIKGDGKKYQFRAKADRYDRHSYIYNFETSGEWETITIPLAEMYPAFRGRLLDIPNYPALQIEELSFMIGNKIAESFRLEINKILLE